MYSRHTGSNKVVNKIFAFFSSSCYIQVIQILVKVNNNDL